MQFLRVVSHCVMHAEPLQTEVHDDSGDEPDRDDSAPDTDADTGNAAPAAASSGTSDRFEVCLLQPRAGVALVPCGHSRFCATCADTVHSFIRFFNENTVITQWFNNMQCIKHVITNKCL